MSIVNVNCRLGMRVSLVTEVDRTEVDRTEVVTEVVTGDTVLSPPHSDTPATDTAQKFHFPLRINLSSK